MFRMLYGFICISKEQVISYKEHLVSAVEDKGQGKKQLCHEQSLGSFGNIKALSGPFVHHEFRPVSRGAKMSFTTYKGFLRFTEGVSLPQGPGQPLM